MRNMSPVHSRRKGEVLDQDPVSSSDYSRYTSAKISSRTLLERLNMSFQNASQRANCSFETARLKLVNGVRP